MIVRTLRRLGAAAAVVTTAAALTGSVLTAPASALETDTSRAAAREGAGWLAGELVDGTLPGFSPDRPDWGLTLDAVLAMDASRSRTPAVRRIMARVAADGEQYWGGFEGSPDARFAGGLAKTALAVQATGGDPRDVGGDDLIAELGALIGADGGLRDTPVEFGNSTNVFGQSYAVVALAEAGRGVARPTRFLLDQQCPAGWFRLGYGADGDDEGCDPATGSASTDATAVAITALVHLRDHGDLRPALRTSVTDAVRTGSLWLRRTQDESGGWAGDQFTPAINANSTGLAVQALAGRWPGLASDGAAFLRRLQARPVSGAALADEQGAVAYDRDAYVAGRAAGIDINLRDQWRRATAQAVLGLAQRPYAEMLP